MLISVKGSVAEGPKSVQIVRDGDHRLKSGRRESKVSAAKSLRDAGVSLQKYLKKGNVKNVRVMYPNVLRQVPMSSGVTWG